ncbi:hypothetical protein SKAU_G00353280 [Synaphobranchus kaupii]|uniref:Uncharacterized protein n=1 Tax=Synaphobranchus kaupii TaxID=118154 RepID=A0A9Q1IHF8_SYNKA|nr:hypothetical protein SKAU_G00353280 [Synaphobranchus kaupii]
MAGKTREEYKCLSLKKKNLSPPTATPMLPACSFPRLGKDIPFGGERDNNTLQMDTERRAPYCLAKHALRADQRALASDCT